MAFINLPAWSESENAIEAKANADTNNTIVGGDKNESNVHHERMDQPKRASLPKFADATVNDRQIRQELAKGSK